MKMMMGIGHHSLTTSLIAFTDLSIDLTLISGGSAGAEITTCLEEGVSSCEDCTVVVGVVLNVDLGRGDMASLGLFGSPGGTANTASFCGEKHFITQIAAVQNTERAIAQMIKY